MSSYALFQQLKALKSGLHTLLERIDSGSADEGGIHQALAGCNEAFRALGDLNRIGERVEQSEVETLRADLQELVRLYAITSTAVAGDMGRVGELATSARKTQKSFAYYEDSDGSGATCDLAG